MRFVEGETNSHVLGIQDMASESPLDDLGTYICAHLDEAGRYQTAFQRPQWPSTNVP